MSTHHNGPEEPGLTPPPGHAASAGAGAGQGLALPWQAARLQRMLHAAWPGLQLEIVPEIDSTNTELMRRARAGRRAPTLLVAEVQSGGRGRLGRSWAGGAPGVALPFSLGLPLAPQDWSGLSLAVGLSVAQSLHPDIGLKWPNDLWHGQRKLAGILVETTAGDAPGMPQRYVVIGVGLNVQEPQTGTEFSTPPAALQQLCPGLTAPEALHRVLPPLLAALRAFETQGFAPLRQRYLARDILAGHPVRLSDGRTGVAAGVGPDGALLVRDGTTLFEVRSAEVSVRPAEPRENP